MIGFIIFLFFIVWLVLQSRPSRVRVWEKRKEVLKPLGRHLKADLQALFRPRRATESPPDEPAGVDVPDYYPEDPWGS